MRRAVRVLLAAWVLVVAAALCLWAANPTADIRVKLRVPTGTNPTIITENDNSGLYKVIRVGQSAYKLVNFDGNVSLQLTNDSAGIGVSGSELTVCYSGSNGPDPVPPLTVGWVQNGQVTVMTLYPGQTASCSGCDLQMRLGS